MRLMRGRGFIRSLSDYRLVYVAPAPILAGLERPDDRMLCRMEVASRVSIGRGIAAADMPACKA
jgi:hypothetical protein